MIRQLKWECSQSYQFSGCIFLSLSLCLSLSLSSCVSDREWLESQSCWWLGRWRKSRPCTSASNGLPSSTSTSRALTIARMIHWLYKHCRNDDHEPRVNNISLWNFDGKTIIASILCHREFKISGRILAQETLWLKILIMHSAPNQVRPTLEQNLKTSDMLYLKLRQIKD